MPVSSREIARRPEADGWKLVRITGSHHHFKHPRKQGRVTVIAKHRATERREIAKGPSVTVRHYPAIIVGDAGTGCSVFFPDLSGCTNGGDTLQYATPNAEQALAGHVALMLEGGDVLPEPGVLDALPRPVDADVREAARLLVRVGLRATVPA